MSFSRYLTSKTSILHQFRPDVIMAFYGKRTFLGLPSCIKNFILKKRLHELSWHQFCPFPPEIEEERSSLTFSYMCNFASMFLIEFLLYWKLVLLWPLSKIGILLLSACRIASCNGMYCIQFFRTVTDRFLLSVWN